MKTLATLHATRRSDAFAAELSLLPGAGQLYKGHYLEGAGVLFLGIALLLITTGVAIVASAFGRLGILLGMDAHLVWQTLLLVWLTVPGLPLLLFWMVEMLDAFVQSDRRHHLESD